MRRHSLLDGYRLPPRMPRTVPSRWHGERQEPDQVEDANTRLDREADVRAVLDAGGEVALRNRLARVLPTSETAHRAG